MLQKVEDSIVRDKEIKRDKEEAERQRIMYMIAEREKHNGPNHLAPTEKLIESKQTNTVLFPKNTN